VPNDKPTISASVGIYLDDIPIATALRNPDLQPVDMQRVEVLRGPQGTLYGGGALGGAIKLVTNLPDYRRIIFGGSIEGSVTNHGGLGENFTGYLNLPITADKLAVRVAAYHRFAPGYIDNVVTGHDGSGAYASDGGRIEIGFKPSERFELVAKALYQRGKVGPGYERVQTDVPYLTTPTHGLQNATFIDETNVDTMRLYNLTATYDLGGVRLTSLTTHIDRKVASITDGSILVQSIVPTLIGLFDERVPIRETMQELRASSAGNGRLTWTIGAFYSDSRRRYDDFLAAPGFTAATGLDTTLFDAPVDYLYNATNRIHEVQKALFGEATFNITPALAVTAGARLYRVRQSFDSAAGGLANDGPSGASAVSKGKGVNPRFILSYKPVADVLISAQAAKGYRLGGANDNVPADLCRADLDALGIANAPRSFETETVWNYELNAKTRFAGGRVTFNPSIYRIDYKNIQLLQALPSCFFNFVANGAKARTQGVELDLSVQIARGLLLRAGGAYTDAKLTSDLPIGVSGQRGDRLPNSPKWSGNVTLRYEAAVAGERTAFVQGDVRYIGDILQQLYDPNPAIAQVPTLKSYTLANLRIGTSLRGVELALFADNIFDRRAFTSGGGSPATGFAFTVARPRVIGVALAFRNR
jgi:iron complex outermembrane receptor protein